MPSVYKRLVVKAVEEKAVGVMVAAKVDAKAVMKAMEEKAHVGATAVEKELVREAAERAAGTAEAARTALATVAARARVAISVGD